MNEKILLMLLTLICLVIAITFAQMGFVIPAIILIVIEWIIVIMSLKTK